MPSLPSNNTWQSIPSTLPPPNRPAACTFAHEAHHCQKQPRSFLEDCLLRLLAWHSCIFLLVHRWNMRHLCILNATNECWNMGKVPVGLPHRPEWVRSFEITGRTKSHGGTRGTNGGWLCFIWNLWEIYGKSTEIKDINQVKWNMLSDQHLVAPSPGLLWNFTKTNDVAVYRALMGEWHGEFKPCPEWIIWPMCRKKTGHGSNIGAVPAHVDCAIVIWFDIWRKNTWNGYEMGPASITPALRTQTPRNEDKKYGKQPMNIGIAATFSTFKTWSPCRTDSQNWGPLPVWGSPWTE